MQGDGITEVSPDLRRGATPGIDAKFRGVKEINSSSLLGRIPNPRLPGDQRRCPVPPCRVMAFC